jgi:hypothetical protein
MNGGGRLGELVFSGKRSLHNIRATFEGSPWLRIVSLRYMARKIKVEELRVLDERIGTGKTISDLCPPGDKSRKRVLPEIRRLVDEAQENQKEALTFMARKIGVDGLLQLEKSLKKLRNSPEKLFI